MSKKNQLNTTPNEHRRRMLKQGVLINLQQLQKMGVEPWDFIPGTQKAPSEEKEDVEEHS